MTTPKRHVSGTIPSEPTDIDGWYMTEQPEQMPPSPISNLAQGAIATFELFRSYVDAGFTRDEALRVVTGILVAGIDNNQGSGA